MKGIMNMGRAVNYISNEEATPEEIGKAIDRLVLASRNMDAEISDKMYPKLFLEKVDDLDYNRELGSDWKNEPKTAMTNFLRSRAGKLISINLCTTVENGFLNGGDLDEPVAREGTLYSEQSKCMPQVGKTIELFQLALEGNQIGEMGTGDERPCTRVFVQKAYPFEDYETIESNAMKLRFPHRDQVKYPGACTEMSFTLVLSVGTIEGVRFNYVTLDVSHTINCGGSAHCLRHVMLPDGLMELHVLAKRRLLAKKCLVVAKRWLSNEPFLTWSEYVTRDQQGEQLLRLLNDEEGQELRDLFRESPVLPLGPRKSIEEIFELMAEIPDKRKAFSALCREDQEIGMLKMADIIQEGFAMVKDNETLAEYRQIRGKLAIHIGQVNPTLGNNVANGKLEWKRFIKASIDAMPKHIYMGRKRRRLIVDNLAQHTKGVENAKFPSPRESITNALAATQNIEN